MYNQSQSDIFANIRFAPAQRIVILIVSLCLFTIVGSAIIGIVMRGGMTTQTLRISTVIQDCIVFILPATVSALLISPYAARFLGVDSKLRPMQLLLALLALMFSIPAMNGLVKLNEQMSLPASFAGMEEWMRAAEEQAKASVEVLLGSASIGSLIVNILIVGVLAGLSEELFFRGALQRIFLSCRMNHHLAIWLTAFVFSAFHMQFFGFFPRLLLGAYFGYIFYWSRSLWLPIILHAFNNSMVVYAMWHEKADDVIKTGGESINTFGADAPMMILTSIIITAFFIRCLYKTRTSDISSEGVN
ncbi:CPBP family intramembrane glutamic endopeptidase [uncultured Duncaniella sp.]|uniref:CPBP family intramembrane glutamic endopeptidase n=2 Tax=uncultured Duncaniella sp. TaxID=2768039 RepID=UPI00262173C6|nr:CPBP family intramembrane glutamic endopeptidase [uncultured Duncaniella sp.]